jgi:replication fork protection complex subunit Tof1/Swi1
MREKAAKVAAAAGGGRIGTMKPTGTKKRRKNAADKGTGKKQKGNNKLSVPRPVVSTLADDDDDDGQADLSDLDDIFHSRESTPTHETEVDKPRPRPKPRITSVSSDVGHSSPQHDAFIGSAVGPDEEEDN